MDTLSEICLERKDDNFRVEFEVISPQDISKITDERRIRIREGLETIEDQIELTRKKIDELNIEIDRLTNHEDAVDYMLAVASGLLTGLIDAFWVGEFSFWQGKAWSNKKVNEYVMQIAKENGYRGERLEGAIQSLEEKFKIPSDDIWKGANVGISAKSHHLDDLAHHPTPLGLFFSILTQFTKTGYFHNREGAFIKIQVTDEGLIGEDFVHKIFAGATNWFFHMVSDMAGSNKTAGVGMGIPGPLVSLIKEASMLPGINKTKLPQKMNDVFVKEKFDLRSEMAVAHELGRQAVPVILNEILVRVFYFVRRVIREIKERGINDIDWKSVLPIRNRTIIRMMTIATGTFTVVDMADATIRSAIKSGGINPAFFKNFILRVNFVGVGRFAVACMTDINMGIQRNKLRNERMALYSKHIILLEAKVFYKQADMWLAAEDTEHTLREVYEVMNKTMEYLFLSIKDMQDCMERMSSYVPMIKEKNPELLLDIEDILKWG